MYILGETVLPRGVEVFISLLHVHRNQKCWTDPLLFNPDRFLRENEVKYSKVFMPFSNGYRNCIGKYE